ncbi:hypothetical protein L9F63_002907 [Diploptera punctata]|uniref:Uncharacterized protein n=1 Tax=Diploptera punctata TaxID=6984 RepID=A0AAD7ZRM9_DIPPU|nr:hypothetical protein L9F63_002907 [Diploptera punctata]
MEFDLGLQTTQFGYNTYHAELLGISASGVLSGSIAADSIATKISLAYVNGTCKAYLKSLQVTRLDGIHVRLTGSRGFGWLLTFIANCVSGSYRNQIIYAVEQAVSRILEEKLEKVSCKDLFPSEKLNILHSLVNISQTNQI